MEIVCLAGKEEPGDSPPSDGSRAVCWDLSLSHRWGIETAEAQLG
jgi:hypothetical protein